MKHPTRILTITLLFALFQVQALKAQTCVLHRAHHQDMPENSLEGIKQALANNVAGVEFDIQITKDGVPVLYHDTRLGDELLGENCPHGEKINLLKAQEALNCSLENGEPLPLLKDALYLLTDYRGFIFFDLKKIPSERFFREVEESGLHHYGLTKVLSFKKRALRPTLKRWPKVETILLSRYIPRGLFYDGIGFNKRLRLFTPLFRVLKKDTALWTLNSKEDIEMAIKKKARFIITDDYDLCESLL